MTDQDLYFKHVKHTMTTIGPFDWCDYYTESAWKMDVDKFIQEGGDVNKLTSGRALNFYHYLDLPFERNEFGREEPETIAEYWQRMADSCEAMDFMFRSKRKLKVMREVAE